MSRGEVVLFLGAGFSVSAFDPSGQPIPDSKQLTRELWEIAFPGDPFDESTGLGDAYYAAKNKSGSALRSLIKAHLTVDAEKLPAQYGNWFSLPWLRCYTLNIDDLELAVVRRFGPHRPIRSISATSGRVQGSNDPGALEVVHLNGAVWDEPEDLTFSDVDYGSRLAVPDAWYVKCTTDVLSRPVLFVGTKLNESTLWQYLEFRKARGPRGLRELRPGSYLVLPKLSQAREYVLRELNVDWIPLTADQFQESALRPMRGAIEEGHLALRAKHEGEMRRSAPHLVSDLAAEPASGTTEYLMGHEPTWVDISQGRAIERECDSTIYAIAKRLMLSASDRRPFVIGGTAGSGKSTSLMRLGLRFNAEGVPVYWIDERSNIDPHKLRALVLQTKRPVAVLVDDADLWGAILSGWARELPGLREDVLFACAIRSSKIGGLLDIDALSGIEAEEFSMPLLSDVDIEDLVKVLDANNRLGILKGKSHSERVLAFQRETGAGRQLLVAMIQATSGIKFKEKVFEEFKELSERQRLLYAIICFVHAQRFSLDRDELLLASGTADNETLNALEALVQRHLVVRDDAQGGYRARHRVIADEVVEAAEFRAFAATVLDGICFAFSNRISPSMPRTARPWRRLIRFINHDYILRVTTSDNGRLIYSRIEPLLHWDFHYWLQRGSLEVEVGDLDLATQFLDQARSLMPDNRLVETEYGYLLMKKAARNPAAPNAAQLFSDGFNLLDDLIRHYGKFTYYPYHVIGSQGLAWVRHGRIGITEKRALLQSLLDIVKEGRRHYPLRRELSTLEPELQREWMMTAVPEGR